MSTPLLCIGHACHDKTSKGYQLGGTVSYASLFATVLDADIHVATSLGPDFQFMDSLTSKGIQTYIQPAPITTCFENVPTPNGRIQKILARAGDISSEFLFQTSVPQPAMVHFGPIANETDPSLFQLFPQSTKGFSIQGWLRDWDELGNVKNTLRPWHQLSGMDIVFASEEDFNHNLGIISSILPFVKILVLTRGKKGAYIYTKNTQSFFPSYPVEERDTTGAGDVFALGFLWWYHHHQNISESAAFAHSLASLLVEGKSILMLPSHEEVLRRYINYKTLYHL